MNGTISTSTDLDQARAEMQENPGLVAGNDPATTTTPTLEQIRAKLIELPDATMEEFAELLHRIHSCAGQAAGGPDSDAQTGGAGA